MLSMRGNADGQLPALLIEVRTLHAQPPFHLPALVEILRLLADVPVGLNHSLDAGFDLIRLLLQSPSRGHDHAVGTPFGIMRSYIENIAETLCPKRLRIGRILEDGIDRAGAELRASVPGRVATDPVDV